MKFTVLFFFPFVDPFALKRNVARSLNSQMVFESIQERFRTAYKYFACPQTRGARGRQKNKRAAVKAQGSEMMEDACVMEEEDDGKGKGSLSGQRQQEPESDDEEGSDEKTLDSELMNLLVSENKSSSSPNGLLDSDEEEEEEESGVSETERPVTSDDLHYEFDKMIFTGGKVIYRCIFFLFQFLSLC